MKGNKCFPSQPIVVPSVNLLGTGVARLNDRDRIATFIEKLASAECQFVGHGGGPLERQRQDSHVYRKTGTLPLIFRKNQSRHYINDEV